MKRFLKIFVSLMLAVIMSMSVCLLAACSGDETGLTSGSDTPNSNSASIGGNSGNGSASGGNSGDQSGSQSGNGGGETPGPGGDDFIFQAEDRSAYTMANAGNVYLTASLYDVMMASGSEAGVTSLLKGYRLGDFYNAALDSALAGEDTGADTLKAFKFTRGTDGNWYNAYKASVHPVLNKFLNYEVSGDGELGLTFAELETYTDTSLLYLIKWSLNNSEIVVNGHKTDVGNDKVKALVEQMINGVVEQMGGIGAATLNAKVSDLAMLVEGNPAAAMNVYGNVKLSEVYGDMPAPYGNWTLGQMYALTNGTTEDFIAFIGDYTFGELAMGAEMPEEYADMKVKDYYEYVAKIATMFQTGDVAGLTEQFGQITIGDLAEMFGEEVPEEYAAISVEYALGFYMTYNEIFESEDKEAAFLEAYGEMSMGTFAFLLGKEMPEQLAEFTVGEVYMEFKAVKIALDENDYEYIEETFGKYSLADFNEYTKPYGFAFGEDSTIADAIIAIDKMADAINEMGPDGYAYMVLGNFWNEVKDMPLGYIFTRCNVEITDDLAEIAELTLEDVYEMYVAYLTETDDEPVEEKPAPAPTYFGPEEEDEEDGAGEGEGEQEMTFDQFMMAVYDVVLLTYSVEGDEGEDPIYEELTVGHVMYWAMELFDRVDASQEEGYSIAGAYKAVLEFIAEHDDEFMRWCVVLDSMEEYEEEYLEPIQVEPTPKYFGYEGDGDYEGGYEGGEYDDDDEPYAYARTSYVNMYLYTKDYIARMYQMYDFLENGAIGQIFSMFTRREIVIPEDCGRENVDAISALYREYFGYSIPEAYAKSEEMSEAFAAAYAKLTINDIIYMSGADEDYIPAAMAAFFETYGEYTPAEIAAFDEEKTAQFNKAMESMAYSMNMASLYPYIEAYDFGSANFKAFALAVASMSLEEVEQGTLVMEAMKNVTVMDTVIACMKMGNDFATVAAKAYADLKAYFERTNVEDELDGNYYSFTGYHFSGADEYYDRVKFAETEGYTGSGINFFEGMVSWYDASKGAYLSGTYEIYSDSSILINISGAQDEETGEYHQYPAVLAYNGFVKEGTVYIFFAGGFDNGNDYALYACFGAWQEEDKYIEVAGTTLVYDMTAIEGYADGEDYEEVLATFKAMIFEFDDDGYVTCYADSDKTSYKYGTYYQEGDTVYVSFNLMVNAEAKTEIKETMTFTATSDSIGYTIAEGTTAEGEYKVIVSYAPYQPEDTNYVYLNVSMWDVEDANERYAAYFYTKGEDGPYFVWVDMVEFFDNVYYAEVPEGYDYVIFVRMNGETEDNNWDNMWNQTNDLYILDYLNCVFTLDSWGGNGSHCTGHWINPAE